MAPNFPNLKQKMDIQIQKLKISNQDEPKEAHTKIHYIQTVKDKDEEKNLKSSEKTNQRQGSSH